MASKMLSIFHIVASKGETKTNAQVSRRLKSINKGADQQIKLLLLGTGESGKTTVFKQILMANGGGFSEDYYLEMRKRLVSNIMEGTLGLLDAMEAFPEYKVEGDEDFDRAVTALREKQKVYLPKEEDLSDREGAIPVASLIVPELPVYIDEETAALLKIIWNNPTFVRAHDALQKIGKYNISDCYATIMNKFMSKFPKWGGKGWRPDDEDILLVRVRTTGFRDISFLHQKIVMRLIDVGGQRSERKKWQYLFENVSGVIFVVATSEYDQTLFEESGVNRMTESINMFAETCNSPHFRGSALLLFFNKVDLFEKKFIRDKIPLNVSGEFKGAPTKCDTAQDLKNALNYIHDLYLVHIDPARKDEVFVHNTTALDKEKMATVQKAMYNYILKRNLITNGLGPLDEPGTYA